MKGFFTTDKIKDATEEIYEAVEKNGYFIILFPLYIPKLGIGNEHAVIGKSRNQTRIANILKAQGITSKKLAPSYYIFFSETLTDEEKASAEREAMMLGLWHDIFD